MFMVECLMRVRTPMACPTHFKENTMTTTELKTALRNGKYAWPGGYPIYFIASDGEALSFDAVRDNYRHVLYAMKYLEDFSGWNIVGWDINWEDEDLTCAHSGDKIESAYGE